MSSMFALCSSRSRYGVILTLPALFFSTLTVQKHPKNPATPHPPPHNPRANGARASSRDAHTRTFALRLVAMILTIPSIMFGQRPAASPVRLGSVTLHTIRIAAAVVAVGIVLVRVHVEIECAFVVDRLVV